MSNTTAVYSLKITTTFPCLKIMLIHGSGKIVFDQYVSDSSPIPLYRSVENSQHTFSTENSYEIELPKGLYMLRASLPYFNQGSNKAYEMPIIMDEYLTLDQNREFRIDLSFTGDRPQTEVIRKQKNEKYEV